MLCRAGDCPAAAQETLIEQVPNAIPGSWHDLPAKHVWSLWTRYAATAFYSHPWAWNEIGFPGPAYPRGYKNLGVGNREPFEPRRTEPPEEQGDRR